MRFLLRCRLPLTVAIAAAFTGVSVATLPVLHAFPAERPIGWISLPLSGLLWTYTGVSLFIGGVACVETLLGRRDAIVDVDHEEPAAATGAAAAARSTGRPTNSPNGALRIDVGRPLRRHWRHLLACASLGLLVTIEGVAHAGARSGMWATSRPRQERSADQPPADGHVFWIDGIPVHGESSYVMDQVDALSRRGPTAAIDFQQGISRSGHAAYAFLVTLLVRLTAPLGSIYTGVLAVNLLLWWGGAVAVYDLARLARSSWWVGLLAGTLVATGLGFTFNAGNAMSAAAAYGAVPIVLWVMNRLHSLSRSTVVYDDVLSACLVGSAALLYGLAPLYLVFAFFRYIGRVELRRLLLWALGIVGLGAAWARLLRWAGGPPINGAFQDSVPFAAAVAAGLVVVLVLVLVSSRWAELAIAGAVGGTFVALFAAIFVAPATLVGIANAATVGLQIPHYMGGLGDVTVRWADQSSSDWISVLDGQRTGLLDGNFLAAFPAPICVFALAGFFRLPRRWCEWCVALIASAALVTVVMNIATGDHHPRLAYMGYPAVYLLAASGLANLFHTTRWFFMRYVRLAGPSAQVFAAAVVVLCLIPAVAPSHASLWGDWSIDAQFHYLTQE